MFFSFSGGFKGESKGVSFCLRIPPFLVVKESKKESGEAAILGGPSFKKDGPNRMQKTAWWLKQRRAIDWRALCQRSHQTTFRNTVWIREDQAISLAVLITNPPPPHTPDGFEGAYLPQDGLSGTERSRWYPGVLNCPNFGQRSITPDQCLNCHSQNDPLNGFKGHHRAPK